MATPNTYVPGSVVTLQSNFTLNGTPTDPTTISLLLKGTNLGLQTYTFAAAQLTRVSAGVYQYNFTVPNSGTFFYRFVGTGTVPDAQEGFLLGASYFE